MPASGNIADSLITYTVAFGHGQRKLFCTRVMDVGEEISSGDPSVSLVAVAITTQLCVRLGDDIS